MIRKDETQARILLGPDARPIALNGHAEEVRGRWSAGDTGLVDGRTGKPLSTKFLNGAVSSYLQGLGNARRPSELRAADPYSNHVWVYAAAMIVATVKSQAPFTIWRETDDEIERRAMRAKSLGRGAFTPPRGSARRAIQRHLSVPLLRRMFAKGMEPDYDHELYGSLSSPNPYQDISQLFQLTDIYLQINGECMWLLTGPDGTRLGGRGNDRLEIWPFSPELFVPILTSYDRGDLVGWKMRAPRMAPEGMFGGSREIRLDIEEVVQFKYPNPADPLRGMSRIAAAAQAIEMDLAVHEHGRALLRNDAVPKGVISSEGVIEQQEEEEYRRRWQEIHGGKDKSGRTAFLFNGFKYQQVGLAPQDMQFLEQRQWDREETLAAMGVPPSVLGVTQFTNYATALAQDKSFWEKTIIPLCRLEESAIDRSLFFEEPDSVWGAFDLRSIEALRVGVQERIQAAREMCGSDLHCPPRVAYEVVGLEVPEYEGDDVALVPALATPLRDVLSGEVRAEPALVPSDLPTAEDEDAAAEDQEQLAAALFINSTRARKARGGKIWRAFVRLEVALEGRMRRAYRSWVRNEKQATLDRFDASARDGKALRAAIESIRKQLQLGAVLPNLKISGDALKSLSRPIYLTTTEETFELTLAEIGVPTFGIDNPAIVAQWDAREKIFTRSVPQTVYNNLSDSLTTGIQAGETVQQLRLRVAEVYDISAGSSKSLLIARTETASLMNGVRNEMFGLQGVTEEDWISAGDEATRVDHLAYGEAGSRPRGFNWLGIQNSTGEGGTLEYPGDTRAPVGQVANCRCVKGVIS